MKKKIIVGGSIGAVVLILLTIFSSVAYAQITTSIKKY